MAKRPNIVIFNPDEWRGDVAGYLGNPAAKTPNLDRLVKTDGVAFEWAFCQNPVSTPSRCSFMSGWYPHVRGHRTMYHMLHPDRGEPMLLKTLKDAGYFVWWGGKNDVVAAQDGFEAFCNVKYRPPHRIASDEAGTQWRGSPQGDNYYSFYRGRLDVPSGMRHPNDMDWAMVEGAIEFIRAAGQRLDEQQPFCLYLPLNYPHPIYAVEEPYFSSIDRGLLPQRTPAPKHWGDMAPILERIAKGQGLQGWSEDQWNELRATYYGMCMRVDDQFGQVLQALRDANLYNDTAVFFLADHGDFAGDYGLVEKNQNTFQDCLTRVPFVIKPPSWLPLARQKGTDNKPNVISNTMVELIDFTETVYATANVVPDYDRFGKSLLPLITGQTTTHRDAVYCEGGRRAKEPQAMELTSGGSSDSTSLYWPRVRMQSIDKPLYHDKGTMIRTLQYKYVHRATEPSEFYDLGSDPREQRNLLLPKYRQDLDATMLAEIARLREQLLTWYQDTCDVVPREEDQREDPRMSLLLRTSY